MRTRHHPDRTEFCDQPDGERSEVYNLIARQYLMQFCPDAVFRSVLSNWTLPKANLSLKPVFC